MTEATAISRAPETEKVGRLSRISTLSAVVVPPLVLVVVAWNGWLLATRANVFIFALLYVLSGFGVTAGFHRLFTHKSFQTVRAVRIILAVLGSMAVQGSVLDWLSDHRKHHAHADKPGDPHSPHVGHEGGLVRGFIHAHTGWLLSDEKATHEFYIKDLLDDHDLAVIDRLFRPIVVISYVLVPMAFGYWVTGTLSGALGGFIWGGVLRVFFGHHATWSVNSVCHIWGDRPFITPDRSTNNVFVALVGFGEGYHHNHHAFPASAKHGLQRFQFDPTWWLIRALEMTHLAWDVKLPTAKQMELRRAR